MSTTEVVRLAPFFYSCQISEECVMEGLLVSTICDLRPNEFSDAIESVDTIKYYKLVYASVGSISIQINWRHTVLSAGHIVLLRPGDHLSFQRREMCCGYLCLVHPEYLSTDSEYILDLFEHFPLNSIRQSATTLDSKQSAVVDFSFRNIITEHKSNNVDKKQATILHLQMILLQIQRAAGRRFFKWCIPFSQS